MDDVVIMKVTKTAVISRWHSGQSQLQQQAARMRRDLEAQLLSSQTAQELLRDKRYLRTPNTCNKPVLVANQGGSARQHHPGLAGRGGGGGGVKRP
jgi:hypothetical protein